MPYAKIDGDKRLIVWSEEQLDGFTVEFDNPEVITGNQAISADDFYIENGKAVFDPSAEHAEQLAEADMIPSAIADLSETVSGNAMDVSALSDAIAELSEMVSNLMSKEG